MSGDLLTYLALFGTGLVAGTLNVIAGGGSLLALPMLIFLGLPPTVANGTNRVAIVVQNAGAAWGFRRRRLLPAGWLRLAAAPALVGAGLGTWTATVISDRALERVLALLMVGVAAWMIWRPLPERGGEAPPPPEGARRWWFMAGVLGFGFYGGFIQAGVGFVILAVTTAAGLDLVRGNALKVTIVLLFTPLSLALFARAGMVDWALGAALAAGNLLGGQFGVHLTAVRGQRWIRKVVTVTVVLFAVRLWFGG